MIKNLIILWITKKKSYNLVKIYNISNSNSNNNNNNNYNNNNNNNINNCNNNNKNVIFVKLMIMMNRIYLRTIIVI
jgi:hypothetical protein